MTTDPRLDLEPAWTWCRLLWPETCLWWQWRWSRQKEPMARSEVQRSEVRKRSHKIIHLLLVHFQKKKKWNLWTFISQLRSCSININISDVDWFLSYLWLLVLTIDGLWPSWISSWRRRSVCPCRLLHRLKDNRKSIINRKCHQCVCVWDSEA